MMQGRKSRIFLTPTDIYKNYYLKEHDRNHKRYIPKSYWVKIWRAFSEVAAEDIVSKGDFILPSRLGTISVRKTKSKSKPINWAAFRKTGKLTYYENDHTNGYLLKFQWLDRPKFKTNFLFNFEPSRKIKKKLSEAVYQDPSIIEKFDTIDNKTFK